MAKDRRWQVQEAKAKFSALIGEAVGGVPQAITRHGHDVAMVISTAEYERLTAHSESSLFEFLSSFGPVEFDLPSREPGDSVREVAF
jgi:prevent-host-death family protein